MRGFAFFAWVLLAAILPAPALGQEAAVAARFADLRTAWALTPSGSPEETIATDTLRAYVRETLGDSLLEEWRHWLGTPTGSDAETQSEVQIGELARERGLSSSLAMEMLQIYEIVGVPQGLGVSTQSPGGNTDSIAIFSDTAVPNAQVTLELLPPPEGLEAGEAFTVQGVITNHSDHPIWLFPETTVLHVPPSIWGSTSTQGAIGASFPSIPKGGQVPERVEAGRSTRFFWRIDPMAARLIEGAADRGPFMSVVRREWLSFWDFLAFHPTTYRLSGVVRVWPRSPGTSRQGVFSTAGSLSVAQDYELDMGTPTVVLLSGGILGGLLGFTLLLVAPLRDGRDLKSLGGWRFLVAGSITAIVMAAVVTILVTRLPDTDFIISISVHDVWGALAIGVAVQWAGLTYLKKLFGEADPSEQRRLIAAGGGD